MRARASVVRRRPRSASAPWAALVLLAAVLAAPSSHGLVAAPAPESGPAPEPGPAPAPPEAGPAHGIVIRLVPSLTSLAEGDVVRVSLVDPLGRTVAAEGANVTVALFFAHRVPEWNATDPTPRGNLDRSAWNATLVDAVPSGGVVTFTYPGAPGASRTPALLWASFEARDGAAAEGWYHPARAAAHFFRVPMQPVLMGAAAPVFAN